MGVGRTRDRSMGFAAMTRIRIVLPLAVSLLAGCKAVPEIAGVVTGGTVGAATANPALGFAVGVATDAAANAGLTYVGRSRQGAEQDAIAQVAGDLPDGAEADWKIEHTIPIGNEHGRLRVTRTFESPLAACKEVAFSVDEGRRETSKRNWFITSICKAADNWKWAAAEPAVERWGYLQ
jgi:hypothetical protein